MRGSLVGLALDDTLSDLARKFNLTLEAIALQTRHIVDSMNAAGHAITAIYMSGGQAKNAALMQLLADCCGMPVVLPAESGAAVVLGAAMLGRFAAEAGRTGKMSGEEQSEKLWSIMVSPVDCVRRRRANEHAGRDDARGHACASGGGAEGEEVAGGKVQDLPRGDRYSVPLASPDRRGLQIGKNRENVALLRN